MTDKERVIILTDAGFTSAEIIELTHLDRLFVQVESSLYKRQSLPESYREWFTEEWNKARNAIRKKHK